MTTDLIQNSQTKATESISNIVLPTEISQPINAINNLPTAAKIALGAGAGLAFLSIVGLIVYFCCKRYQVVRRREGMQISYPLVPVSPGLRRRR